MRFWYNRVFVSVRRCHDPLREAARIAVGYRHPRPTRSATFNAILSGGAVASYKAAQPAHRQITAGHRIVAAYVAAYVAAPTEATPQVDALVKAKVAIKRKADEGDFERRVRQATGDLRHEADKHLQHANEANQRAVVAVSAAATSMGGKRKRGNIVVRKPREVGTFVRVLEKLPQRLAFSTRALRIRTSSCNN